MSPYPGYAAAAEHAARECAAWLADNPSVPLVDDVWDVRNDCPLWRAGLSAFQAQWAWRKARELVGVERAKDEAEARTAEHEALLDWESERGVERG